MHRFPVPAVGGLWTAQWQQNDGRALAEIPLRVSTNSQAPQLSAAADRAMIGGDGELNLTLKSVNGNNEPVPYLAGRVLVKWTTPDIFTGWGDYHFGREDNNDKPPAPVATFITDNNGAGKIHLNLKPPEDGSPLHTVQIDLHADRAAGALDPDPLLLPVRPDNYIIGIKPLGAGRKIS